MEGIDEVHRSDASDSERALAPALGQFFPNPMTARVAYEVAMRAVEIAFAMTGPVIDVDLCDVAIDEFGRLEEIVEIGRHAARAALPRIEQVMASR